MTGVVTLTAKVTCVTDHDFWLLLNVEELLVLFEHFPWFKNSTMEQITDVQWPTQNHLYWPQLDVDFSVESIRSPASFPLITKKCELNQHINCQHIKFCSVE